MTRGKLLVVTLVARRPPIPLAMASLFFVYQPIASTGDRQGRFLSTLISPLKMIPTYLRRASTRSVVDVTDVMKENDVEEAEGDAMLQPNSRNDLAKNSFPEFWARFRETAYPRENSGIGSRLRPDRKNYLELVSGSRLE
jgi:hypothetical protein